MRCIVVVIAATMLVLPRVAHAQRHCAPSPRATDGEEAREEAFALYAQSRERYAEGDFEAAVTLLERAYARHAEPVLLYNLARTLEGMARWGDAADAYECYLQRQPDARDRGAIAQRVETLRRSDVASRLPPLPDDTITSEPVDDRAAPRSLEAGPFVLLGLGAAAIAGGAIEGGVALAMRDEAQADPVHASAAATERTAQDHALAAAVVWGVAGAMVLAGLVWGLLDWTAGSGEDRTHVEVGLGSVAVSGRF